ncbi:hypothetical protein NPIL_393811 [Nephila pilipes]|uniref:Uncharacterized protein n=1 Tax=Nephila pilipes TaxID=299642 RepID=A0A8X6UKZ5_NEPPI|nr:hypothetical protein NPIL_393811 [Nephila pilipes]
MNKSPEDFHATSVVAQSKKDRVHVLGRELCLKNKLVSKTLIILQLNINGISTNEARIKLDQVLNLAETHGIKIIALQETKLKISTSLKISPGYQRYQKRETTKHPLSVPST